MATTYIEYDGTTTPAVDGINTDFTFPFPYLKIEDVRASINGVGTTAFTINPSTPTLLQFNAGAQPTAGTTLRIYRQTDPDATPATFFAGSSVRAKDLNDNFDQILFIMQERQNFLQDLQLGQLPTGGLGTAALQDDAVTADKLRDDVSIDGNRAVTTDHIRDNAVTMAKLAGGSLPTDITISTDNIVNGTIVNEDISNSAAIAGTKVSPDFGSQDVTTTGGATISGTATISGLTYPTSDGSADEVLKTNGTGTLSFGTIQGVPTGSVFYFAASTAPTGYLKANGDIVPNGSGTIQGVTADFSALYAILGSTYGSAGQLPDLRGEFIRGWDDGRGIDSGRTLGSAQTEMIGPHNHGITDPGHSHSYSSGNYANIAGNEANASRGPSAKTTGSATTGITVNNNSGTENRPRNIALLACIKY